MRENCFSCGKRGEVEFNAPLYLIKYWLKCPAAFMVSNFMPAMKIAVLIIKSQNHVRTPLSLSLFKLIFSFIFVWDCYLVCYFCFLGKCTHFSKILGNTTLDFLFLILFLSRLNSESNHVEIAWRLH